jgi:hypothetical protein
MLDPAAAKVPAGQLLQSSLLAAAVPSEYVPEGHIEHSRAPAVSENVPGAHLVQVMVLLL